MLRRSHLFFGAADVDGNGLPDLIKYGDDGIIRFNEGLPGNMMTDVVTPAGGT